MSSTTTSRQPWSRNGAPPDRTTVDLGGGTAVVRLSQGWTTGAL
ncbi:hypothetical protein [Streptomyces sp. NPDC052114]